MSNTFEQLTPIPDDPAITSAPEHTGSLAIKLMSDDPENASQISPDLKARPIGTESNGANQPQEHVDNGSTLASQNDKKSPTIPRPKIHSRHTSAYRKSRITYPESSDADLFDIYMRGVKRELLTKDEEVYLGRAVQSGLAAGEALRKGGETLSLEERQEYQEAVTKGEIAHKHFTEANLKLVVSVAKKYVREGVSIMDLIQEGSFGLMVAVDKFDPEKGFKFSTYATWWIRQAIRRALSGLAHDLTVTEQAHNQAQKLRKTRIEFLEEHNRWPTDQELMDSLEVDAKTFSRIARINQNAVRLDKAGVSSSGNDSEESSLLHFLADPSSDFTRSLDTKYRMEDLLQPLDPEERQMLILNYGLDGQEPLSQEKISELCGLTRAKVQSLSASARAKLRSSRSQFNQD